MYDHHLSTTTDWNNPQSDVMLFYRGRGLQLSEWRCRYNRSRSSCSSSSSRNNSRAQPLGYYTSQLSAIPVSPDPMSPSPSPHLHHRRHRLGHVTHVGREWRCACHAAIRFIVTGSPASHSARPACSHCAGPPTSISGISSPCSKSRRSSSLHSIAPHHSRHSATSFSSLSLSVHCTSPRVELLHEDERVRRAASTCCC